MKELFIPYEQALALKELGFDKNCLGWYENRHSALSVGESWRSGKNSIDTPIFQQAFDFLLRKYGHDYSIKPVYGEKHYKKYRCNIYYNEKLIQVMKNYFPDNPYFDSKEEAELECLKKLIEIAQKS